MNNEPQNPHTTENNILPILVDPDNNNLPEGFTNIPPKVQNMVPIVVQLLIFVFVQCPFPAHGGPGTAEWQDTNSFVEFYEEDKLKEFNDNSNVDEELWEWFQGTIN